MRTGLAKQVERRHQKRFVMRFPLAVMMPECRIGPTCITRNVSSDGVYFWADSWDDNMESFEFCTILPEQVTMGGSVMAKCSATVLRINREKFSKVGIAAKVEKWTVL